ncbi:MAG TPA: FHA domain-containing protein [Myxococcales bacterium]
MAARELDVTRIVRLGLLTDREEATNSGTRVAGLRVSHWLSIHSVFNAHQREMAAVLSRERRPGVMVFLLTPNYVEGSCWLAATDGLRAGTLGRHGCVDLHVPRESGLSLRHCLFLVRRAGEGVLTHVVDLSSAAGLRLEDQRTVRALAADGPFFLHVPGAVIASFPTGGPLPWDPDAMPAFDSLAPRRILSRLERAPVLQRARLARESSVTVIPGPVLVEAGTLLEPGEVAAGELLLASREGRERLAVGYSALDRGVVIGRDDRCAGGSALSHRGISRVHALLIRRDERLFLADAGSTNGTWRGEEEVKCARLQDRSEYLLGGFAALSWNPLD